jgi:thiol:disulfide interchange protein DsbC
MKNFVRSTIFAIAAFATCAAIAATPASKTTESVVGVAEKARIMAIFEQKSGKVATDVESSPLPNFYTVISDVSVYYIEKNGKWLFDGHLVDLDTRTSVTAVKRLQLEGAGLPALDWRTLNLNDAIKTVRGKAVPGRVLVTFEDPNCGFCKALKPQLDKLQNLTVFTFPVAFLGPDSQSKNEAVWCSADRTGAWEAALTDKQVSPVGPCDTSALARNGKLAHELKVRGTPTMFLVDGSRIPGLMDAASLEARLQALQK